MTYPIGRGTATGVKAFAAVAAVVAGFGLVLGLVVVGASSGAGSVVGGTAQAYLTVAQQSMCQQLGQEVPTLTVAQSQMADQIVAITNTVSGENSGADEIALTAALTESDLTDVSGGLGGAYGVFQQTPPAWGTVQQIMDPAYAATTFAAHLVNLAHWSQMPPWVAAQDVQASGAGSASGRLTIPWPGPWPAGFGQNYKAKWAQAEGILATIAGQLTAANCGAGPSGMAGPPSRHGLSTGYTLPAGITAGQKAVLTYALAQLGKPYVWGAAGPMAFDCSGLTMMAWRQAGVTLAHYTVSQEQEGRRISPSAVQPGDLVLTPGSDSPGPGLPGHVGVYIGAGLVLNAEGRQEGVVVQSWQQFVDLGLDAVVDPAEPPG